MTQLTTSQRQYLRKLAHDLRPVVQVGKNGLSDQVLASAAEALNAHELIKVKLLDPGDARRELAQDLADGAGGTLISVIGNIVILYREQPNRERRKIMLPV